jgi:hypothetical protein
VLAAGLGVMFGPNGGDDEPEPSVAEVARDQPTAEPAPPSVAAPPVVVTSQPSQPSETTKPEPAATVGTLHFATNVAAQVLDARDRAIYGRTDDAAGIGLPLSEQGVALILHAEGYEDLPIEVVPNRERKNYQFELRKLGSKSGKPRTSGTNPSSTTEPAAEPADLPKPAGPTLPSKGTHDGEIKNPFGK